ncbi:MAG: ATP-binding cassette domain-containing protein [Bacteroidales bacterium]|nr:ATP-binding cassette domain-containing protein [Bacteroidales bacterium]
MIRLEDISFSYHRKKVFDGLSMELGEGNVYGLLGLNGAGKSTLLYLMSGLLFADRGQVKLNGIDVNRRRPESLSETYIVPEEFSLPDLTFDKYIRINSPFYPKFSMEMLDKSLEAFGMTRDLNLSQLSMGQKKKASMCFALATNTSLLLMDEPTNGLDIPSKSQFRKAVAQCMTDDRAIVISTHQVRDIENLLDRIVILDGGHILCNESVAKISEKLKFVQIGVGERRGDVLYEQPSTIGSAGVVINTDGDETPLNVELFFNAMLTETARMIEAMK